LNYYTGSIIEVKAHDAEIGVFVVEEGMMTLLGYSD